MCSARHWGQALLVSRTGSIQHCCVIAAASDAVAEGGCWPAGGIGSSLALQILCAPGTEGQNPLLPSNISIPPITFDITVELCPQGSEERGTLCQPCDLNFYNYNSTSCQACPEGECRHFMLASARQQSPRLESDSGGCPALQGHSALAAAWAWRLRSSRRPATGAAAAPAPTYTAARRRRLARATRPPAGRHTPMRPARWAVWARSARSAPPAALALATGASERC